jgi:hypothetical protein
VIFSKIDQADVFVAYGTPVAQLTSLQPAEGESPVKKLINSNVAIEYGYAVQPVTDELIVLVQNTHCGNREDLPFDLKDKGSLVQYKLAPEATKAERTAEKAKLVGSLIVALRACVVTLARSGPPAPKCIVSNCLIRRMNSLCVGIPPLHRMRRRHWTLGHC